MTPSRRRKYTRRQVPITNKLKQIKTKIDSLKCCSFDEHRRLRVYAQPVHAVGSEPHVPRRGHPRGGVQQVMWTPEGERLPHLASHRRS